MRVLILGGGGFIGRRLAEELLANGGLTGGEIASLILADVSFPQPAIKDPRVELYEADFSNHDVIDRVFAARPDLVFHLAAIVSGEAEKDFELGMSVNFHASLQLLEYCRKSSFRPRIVFSSSCGVFGGDVSERIIDSTGPKPRSSYGTQKAMVELLINDYSRRGFVDGRSVRLPTITVRPGKPNAATSSFLSGIIREPLNGQSATYPVPAESRFWIQSPRSVVKNLIHAANIDEALLGDDRMITLPGLTVSVGEMIASLERTAGKDVASRISCQPDEFLQRIVLTWPANFDTKRADGLGFVKDRSVDQIISDYINDIRIINQ